MARSIDDAGDRWEAYLGVDAPHPGVLPLIFHCTSNTSNGYRVVEVPEAEFGAATLEELDDDALSDLFGRAQPFDFTHDPKAGEHSVGDTPLR